MKLKLPPSYRAARILLVVVLVLTIVAAALAAIDSSLPMRVWDAATGIGDWARGEWESS